MKDELELSTKLFMIGQPALDSGDCKKMFKQLADYITENYMPKDKYNELIMAVGNKYQGETRHQTALRYIRLAEQGGEEAQEDKITCNKGE